MTQTDCSVKKEAAVQKSADKRAAIKVCGITSVDEAKLLINEQVEYLGIVMFFPKSKRNTQIDTAKEITALAAGKIKTVAVTVSPKIEQLEVIEKAGFDYIQIHSDMADEVYNKASIPIIRAVNVDNAVSITDDIKKDKIIAILYDGSKPGAGKTFDWDIIQNIDRQSKMLVLAGGLNASNVTEAIEKIGPDIVDVSSGVEYSEKLGKDPEKIKEFVRKCRA